MNRILQQIARKSKEQQKQQADVIKAELDHPATINFIKKRFRSIWSQQSLRSFFRNFFILDCLTETGDEDRFSMLGYL